MEHLRNTKILSRKWLTILLCLAILLSPSRIAIANDKKTGNNLSISMNNDRIVEGELLAVQDNVLIILNRGVLDTSYVCITEVTHINIEKKNKFLDGAIKGFFIGGMTGVIIGLVSGDNERGFFRVSAPQKAVIIGTGLSILGAVIGGTGRVISNIGQSVSITSTSPDQLDLVCNNLKKYARFEGTFPSDFSISPVTFKVKDPLYVVETTNEVRETKRYNQVARSGGFDTIKRFHISISPGYFKSSGIGEIRDIIESIEFTDKRTSSNWPFGGVTTIEYPHTLKNRNICFKDIKLDYSLNGTFTVGMAYSPLGEHGASGRHVIRGLDYREFLDEEYGQTPYEYVDTYIIGFYTGHAFFLTASYFSLPDAFYKNQTIKLIVGIGYVPMALDFYGSDSDYSVFNLLPVDHKNFINGSFGVLVSAEMMHFINKNISIGLNADYKYAMVKTNGFSINAPYSYYDGPPFEGGERRQGALHVDIPERTWNLGGLGFGVSMGMHF